MAYVLDAVYTKMMESLLNVVGQAVNTIVALAVVVIFFVVGYYVSLLITKLVKKAFDMAQVEEHLMKTGVYGLLSGFTLTNIVSFLLQVYINLVFLGAAAEVVGISFFQDIITGILQYLPNLVEGLAILVVALLFVGYLDFILKKHKPSALAKSISTVVQVFVAYTAVVIALPLILPGVKITILERAFELFVAAIAVAIGLGLAIAMGWGLKDSVAAAAKKNQKMMDGFFGELAKK